MDLTTMLCCPISKLIISKEICIDSQMLIALPIIPRFGKLKFLSKTKVNTNPFNHITIYNCPREMFFTKRSLKAVILCVEVTLFYSLI